MESTLFLVRVWRRLVAGRPDEFRASVRAAHVDQSRLFTRADELGRFLDAASRRDRDAGVGPSASFNPPPCDGTEGDRHDHAAESAP